MNRNVIFSAMAFAAVLFGLIFLLDGAAEAKGRLGGGSSFGSRPSYQRSAPAPAPSSPSMTKPAPGTAAPIGAAAPGRFGGMLGGMLMGGLIGSLLFGGGLHGFAGPGLLDILLVGGGLFLLMRFLRARRASAESAAGWHGSVPGLERGDASAWGSPGPASGPAGGAGAPPVPAGFDVDEFLKGAKAIFTRLQGSWDRRDLEDIRGFTSPEVFAEIRRQAEEDPEPGRTEILLLNARLIEVREEDGREIASVLYEPTLREGGAEQPARQLREIWHFSREKKAAGAFWILEGIQQVEE